MKNIYHMFTLETTQSYVQTTEAEVLTIIWPGEPFVKVTISRRNGIEWMHNINVKIKNHLQNCGISF